MDVQKRFDITIKLQCTYHGIPYKQAFRWCTARTSTPPEQKEPLSLEVIESLVEANNQDKVLAAYLDLQHHQRQTHGSGEFHKCLESIASRRQIQDFITAERKDHNKSLSVSLTRISWTKPRICWAMDDTHLFTEAEGTKIWIHNIKDLGSQYILPPVTGLIMSGKEVADNLKTLFERFGAPLVLKRDNGSNLCSKEVNTVLRKYKVIALTSPAYYSMYNGSIEQANGLLKKRIGTLCEKHQLQINRRNAPVLAELAAHEENNRVKRSTKKRSASFHFFSLTKRTAHKKRKEVINDIVTRREHLEAGKELTGSQKKWINRRAVEDVLEKRGYTKITEPQ